ncbi:MAG: PHP domain-containing protein [Clostridia bacterium]|nr:PHP domain-containing protein [Clostridia bacterium]
MDGRCIDLHTHSNKSDGSMTPAELVCHAKEQGLSAVALTDHDTIDGVSEALEAGKKHGIEVVPGIEMSAKSDTELHILGYYIDINNPKFSDGLEAVRQNRKLRNKITCEKLRECGFDITEEDARAEAGGMLLGRAHFAKAMVKMGYIGSVKEAFDKYLGSGKPCFCTIQHFTAKECISVIKDAGGAAFAAHLHHLQKSDEELFEYLKELKSFGLCGIEGYYTEYTPEMQDKFMSFAKELDLCVSGGTDFHADMKPHISIGTGLGDMKIPYSVLEGIKKAVSIK